MANPEQDARSGHGRYIASLTTAERDAECARLRTRGLSYQAVANEMGMAISSVHDAVGRALKEARVEAGKELQALELDRLDTLYLAATEVLERDHVTVSHGRIIRDDDGEPLLDDAPKLGAIDRLLRVSESRRKLLGLDAPSRVSVDAENLGAEIGALLNAMTEGNDDAATRTQS